jgi:hypothetical protein
MGAPLLFIQLESIRLWRNDMHGQIYLWMFGLRRSCRTKVTSFQGFGSQTPRSDLA